MAPAACSLAAFQAQDIRADGASRHVAVDSQRVSIARRFQGIDMRVAVPLAAYEGVVLRSQTGLQGGVAYEVRLTHRDPDLSITLCEAEDDAEGASALRTWARYLELPELVEDAGQAPAGEEGIIWCVRRNRGIPASRRPRFLTRRKPGAAGHMDIVHHEDEIIAYE